MSLLQFLIINFGALVTAVGGIFLKKLSDQSGENNNIFEFTLFAIKNEFLWIAGICYLLPIFLWIYLLKSMELTKLQPLLSVVYIYTIFLAMFFLGESLSLVRIFGIVMIIVGVSVVGRT